MNEAVMTLEECYAALGGDYNEMLRRFNNAERISKFVRMFLRDTSFDQLSQAMQARDPELAFRAAHTLKGVALNLGLSRLAHCAVELTETLRPGQITAQTEEWFIQTEEAYRLTIDAIETYNSGIEQKG